MRECLFLWLKIVDDWLVAIIMSVSCVFQYKAPIDVQTNLENNLLKIPLHKYNMIESIIFLFTLINWIGPFIFLLVLSVIWTQTNCN